MKLSELKKQRMEILNESVGDYQELERQENDERQAEAYEYDRESTNLL